MARTRTHLWWLLLVPVGVLVALRVLKAASHGIVSVHQCVSASGVQGWLGVQFALLREDGACPSGTLAIGGDARHAMTVVAIVTLPVLLAHLAGMSVWLGIVAMLHRVIAGVVTVLRRLIPALPVPGDVISFWYAGPVPGGHRAPHGRLAASCLWRRGPPALHAV